MSSNTAYHISEIGRVAQQVGKVALIHVEAQDSVYVYIFRIGAERTDSV